MNAFILRITECNYFPFWLSCLHQQGKGLSTEHALQKTLHHFQVDRDYSANRGDGRSINQLEKRDILRCLGKGRKAEA